MSFSSSRNPCVHGDNFHFPVRNVANTPQIPPITLIAVRLAGTERVGGECRWMFWTVLMLANAAVNHTTIISAFDCLTVKVQHSGLEESVKHLAIYGFLLLLVLDQLLHWGAAFMMRHRCQLWLCSDAESLRFLKIYGTVSLGFLIAEGVGTFGGALNIFGDCSLSTNKMWSVGLTFVEVIMSLPFPALAVMLHADCEALRLALETFVRSDEPKPLHAALRLSVRSMEDRWSFVLVLHILSEGATLMALWGCIILNVFDGENQPPVWTVPVQVIYCFAWSMWHVLTAFLVVWPLARYNTAVELALEEADISSVLFKLLYFKPPSFEILGFSLSCSQYLNVLKFLVTAMVIPGLSRVSKLVL